MGLTKSQRIILLLIIDSVFFVVELSVGGWCFSVVFGSPANNLQAMPSTRSLSSRMHFIWYADHYN